MLPGLHGILVGVRQNLAFNPADKDASVTLSNSDRTMTVTVASKSARSVASLASGAFYYEAVLGAFTGGVSIGVGNASAPLDQYGGYSDNGIVLVSDGKVYRNVPGVGGTASGLGALVATDVVGVRVDRTGNTIAFNKNGGAWSGNFTPPTGTLFVLCSCSGGSLTLNVSPTYAVPSGFSYWS